MTTTSAIGSDAHPGIGSQRQPESDAASGRTVWIDDENAVVRRGMVSSLLAERIHVVGESAGLRPAPPLQLVNVLVFAGDGVEASLVMARARSVGTRLIATVRQATDAQLRRLADDGACAILLMSELTPESLVNAVRSATGDRMTMSNLVLTRLLEHAARLSPCGAGRLTTRESQVLQLLADGEDTRSIALELNYSERTVKNVVHDVLTKLNCRTRAQAVGVAMRSGIL